MAEILNGREVAAALDARTREAAEMLREGGTVPCLAIVRVGDAADDIAYERQAGRKAEKLGIHVRRVRLAAEAPQQELLGAIRALNSDSLVHGILLLRPLPPHVDEDLVRNTLSPSKDVDGITDYSMSGLFTGVGFQPCTAAACLAVLDHYGIDPAGRRATVIGRSQVVGKPVAMMLLARDATVTICHSRTADLAAEARRADILVAAMGRAGAVGADCMNEQQVILDVGINVDEDGRLRGDVDYEAALQHAGAVTPVPGGVGTVTSSILMQHVVTAAMGE